ncbi:hypothetical protein E3N88_13818 [Mikania micrantha]|uniref:Reverse transcriptase domain-containing protein n=1 Tax=Mikania micrantha TaxID=192012 RepID=A0A5N6P0W0_9ASTR|nr:hypothetical protein E3N88_13818 [Mikania micrantha]
MYLGEREVYVLFDTGATHSVVSHIFARHINSTPVPLDSALVISTPGGSSVIITHIYYECPLRLDNVICNANLFPMQMGEFDVILGMDWLAQHRATIDCYSKRILFGDFRCPKFVYQGIQPRKSIKIISALKAQKLLSHGCYGFIAAIKDMSTDTSRIENFPIVCDFFDVFPEELPGIPPDREVEFAIDPIPVLLFYPTELRSAALFFLAVGLQGNNKTG